MTFVNCCLFEKSCWVFGVIQSEELSDGNTVYDLLEKYSSNYGKHVKNLNIVTYNMF